MLAGRIPEVPPRPPVFGAPAQGQPRVERGNADGSRQAVSIPGKLNVIQGSMRTRFRDDVET